MAAAVEDVLDRLRKRIPHLLAVVVTDKSGVVFFKSVEETAKEARFDGLFSAQHVLASDQASKLGIGSTEKITAVFSDYVVVQSQVPPMVLSLVGTHSVNVGLVNDLLPDLQRWLEGVRRASRIDD